MTSNLLFLPMGIPASALSITLATDAVGVLINGNLLKSHEKELVILSKGRSLFNKLSPATYLHYTFDCGATKAAEYIVFKNGKKATEYGTTNYNLKRSSDNVSYSSQTSGSFTSASSFTDTKGQDLLVAFTLSSSYRYWRMELSATSSEFDCFGFHIGTFFDMGIDPEVFDIRKEDTNESKWISENGNVYTSQKEKTRYLADLTFIGVSDSKLVDFYNNVITPDRRHGTYIYTANTNLIGSYSLLHCEISNIKTRKIWTNYNEVELTVSELLQ